MLNIAKTKYPNINFKQNDCSTLQLDSGTADFCSIAFGLRNIINKEESIKEMYRILKPNGKLMYLDFSNNKNFVDKTFNKFLLTFGNDKYKYLAISKSNFWNVKELKEIPSSRWDKVVTAIITGVVGALIGAFLALILK